MISEAISLAKTAHFGQTRKDGTPYICHPARVAMALSLHYPGITDEMIAAAWLHDVLEDTTKTFSDIQYLTNLKVAKLVQQLTFKPVGLDHLSYRDRKLVQNNHIADASYDAKIIKIFDRLDNLEDLERYTDTFEDSGNDKEYASAHKRLASYLDVSWELVKLLSTQNVSHMNPDVLTMLRVKCVRIAQQYGINLS